MQKKNDNITKIHVFNNFVKTFLGDDKAVCLNEIVVEKESTVDEQFDS